MVMSYISTIWKPFFPPNLLDLTLSILIVKMIDDLLRGRARGKRIGFECVL